MTFYDSELEAPRRFFSNGGFKMAAMAVIKVNSKSYKVCM